jgi:hypothetical protein
MRHIIYFVLLILISIADFTKAQSDGVIWARSFGGNQNDLGHAATDAYGNIYFTGYFSGSCDFDPGPATVTLNTGFYWDIFIAKYDIQGDLIWVKQVGGPGADAGTAIAIHPMNGHIYVTGTFEQTVDFDPGPGINMISSGGMLDVFLMQLDTSGNMQHVMTIPAPEDASSTAIICQNQGNGDVFTTGAFFGTVDFNPGPLTYNLYSFFGTDLFILQTDSALNFKRVAGIQGNGLNDEGLSGIAISPSQNQEVIMTGNFSDTIDCDPDTGQFILSTSSDADIFVCKLDSALNFMWAKQMGGPGLDVGHKIAVDNAGKIYTTGYFEQVADFNPDSAIQTNLTSVGLVDLYISILDDSGSFVNAVGTGSSDYDVAEEIVVSTNGNITITGYIRDTVDFDPGPQLNFLSASGSDAFLWQLDNNLSFNFARIWGGSGNDFGSSLSPAPSGKLILSGHFNSTIMPMGGANLFNTSFPQNDVFFAMIDPSLITGVNYTHGNTGQLGIYPNPAKDQLRISAPLLKLPAVVTITGITGNILFRGEIYKNEMMLDVENYASGIYFLGLTNENQSLTQKFIIAK